jgi:uncharacterized membrane protein YhhN
MLLPWLAAAAAALDLTCVAVLGPDAPVRLVTKPLPTLILAAMAFGRGGPTLRLLGAGLFLAAIGDETLLHAGTTPFLIGTLCFAVMHRCYIGAYVAIGAGLARFRPVVAIALGLAVAGTLVAIVPHAGTLGLAVAIYSFVLATMVLFALNLLGRIDARIAWPIGAGALVFMASDTLLAYSTFYPGFPLTGKAAELVIVGTYFAAQLLIATGVAKAGTRSEVSNT